MMAMDKAIIVSDQCGACKALLHGLDRKGALANYRVINVSSPEGAEIVSKLGITGVPDCIFIDKDKDGSPIARRCTEEETKEVLKEASGA